MPQFGFAAPLYFQTWADLASRRCCSDQPREGCVYIAVCMRRRNQVRTQLPLMPMSAEVVLFVVTEAEHALTYVAMNRRYSVASESSVLLTVVPVVSQVY